jgi:hypothetical protein
MTRYGLFQPTSKSPLHVYEGDYMVQDGEYVQIFKNPANEMSVGMQVAAIRLDKGQSVRELKQTEG